MSFLKLLRFVNVLVEGLATNPIMGNMLSFLLSIIQFIFQDISEQDLDLLLEDVLKLWNQLCHLPVISYNERIHALFEVLPLHFSKNMECFPSVMGLIDIYIDVGGVTFLQTYH